MMKLKYKKVAPNAITPRRATSGSGGYDLFSTQDVTLRPGASYAVGTGIEMEIPSGYVGLICPKSGLAANFATTVLNGPGVIDPDYRGEVKAIMINEGEQPKRFAPGDKVAQILFVETEEVEFEEVAELSSTERGTGGFGSTGK
jgi:dUTP pyrophosphatase